MLAKGQNVWDRGQCRKIKDTVIYQKVRMWDGETKGTRRKRNSMSPQVGQPSAKSPSTTHLPSLSQAAAPAQLSSTLGSRAPGCKAETIPGHSWGLREATFGKQWHGARGLVGGQQLLFLSLISILFPQRETRETSRRTSQSEAIEAERSLEWLYLVWVNGKKWKPSLRSLTSPLFPPGIPPGSDLGGTHRPHCWPLRAGSLGKPKSAPSPWAPLFWMAVLKCWPHYDFVPRMFNCFKRKS